MTIREPQFKINDLVYHKTPESGKGIVVDITYSILTNLYRYNVMFGRSSDDDVWCYEHEISETINF